MPTYRVHGLRLDSDLPLPELPAGASGPGEALADAAVRLARADGAPATIPPAGRRFVTAGGGLGLAWPGIGVFTIRDGTEIVADLVPGADEALVRAAFLGPVLAVLLHQRGRVVLHASAVAGPRGVVAFAGGAGGGKSTTAAALHARGLALVADDVLSLTLDPEGRVTVYPGSPLVWLTPDVVGALDAEATAAGPAASVRDGKQAWPARARAGHGSGGPGALPLAGLYLLEDGTAAAVEALAGPAALFALLRHSYCASLLDAPGRHAHFRACAQVARQIPVRRLTRPRALEALPALAALVLAQEATEPARA